MRSPVLWWTGQGALDLAPSCDGYALLGHSAAAERIPRSPRVSVGGCRCSGASQQRRQRARLNNVFAGVISAEKPVSNKNT